MSSEIILPKKKLTRITEQSDFPQVDLDQGNTAILNFMLSHNAGLDAYATFISGRQRYIYLIANRELQQIGTRPQYSPASLASFSHGFAMLETITNIVRGARDDSRISSANTYDNETSVRRVGQYLIDPRSETAVRRDEPVAEPGDAWDVAMDAELLGYEEPPVVVNSDRLASTDSDSTSFAIPLTQAMLDAYEGNSPALLRGAHDRPAPEKIFTERSTIIQQRYPNVFDVLYTAGQTRHETMPQQYARLAGAGLALALLTQD